MECFRDLYFPKIMLWCFCEQLFKLENTKDLFHFRVSRRCWLKFSWRMSLLCLEWIWFSFGNACLNPKIDYNVLIIDQFFCKETESYSKSVFGHKNLSWNTKNFSARFARLFVCLFHFPDSTAVSQWGPHFHRPGKTLFWGWSNESLGLIHANLRNLGASLARQHFIRGSGGKPKAREPLPNPWEKSFFPNGKTKANLKNFAARFARRLWSPSFGCNALFQGSRAQFRQQQTKKKNCGSLRSPLISPKLPIKCEALFKGSNRQFRQQQGGGGWKQKFKSGSPAHPAPPLARILDPPLRIPFWIPSGIPFQMPSGIFRIRSLILFRIPSRIPFWIPSRITFPVPSRITFRIPCRLRITFQIPSRIPFRITLWIPFRITP